MITVSPGYYLLSRRLVVAVARRLVHELIIQATQLLLSDDTLDHEYLPILGLPEYTVAAAKLILGSDSPAIQEKRAVSVQTISGTGANHLGGLFLSKFYGFNGVRQIYLSNPTWGKCTRRAGLTSWKLSITHIANHQAIFRNVGIEPIDYPYYDPKTIGLDINGFMNAIKTAPERSVFLLHACAHNPTGVDPTREEWKTIADAILERNHYAFFDCAYQGFASGDLDNDAFAVRYFASRGVPMLVCQVCSTPFHVVLRDAES